MKEIVEVSQTVRRIAEGNVVKALHLMALATIPPVLDKHYDELRNAADSLDRALHIMNSAIIAEIKEA